MNVYRKVYDGYKNKESLGIVMGSAARGSNLFRDMAAKIADKLGGRVSGYEHNFDQAVDEAVEKMTRNALEAGATAVECLTIHPFAFPMENGGLFVVLAYGDAIREGKK